jgi:hypothetical protein
MIAENNNSFALIPNLGIDNSDHPISLPATNY